MSRALKLLVIGALSSGLILACDRAHEHDEKRKLAESGTFLISNPNNWADVESFDFEPLYAFETETYTSYHESVRCYCLNTLQGYVAPILRGRCTLEASVSPKTTNTQNEQIGRASCRERV